MSGTEALEKPLATLAFCWRIERRDGVTIGLTSHDRDLEIGHMLYRAAPGMTRRTKTITSFHSFTATEKLRRRGRCLSS